MPREAPGLRGVSDDDATILLRSAASLFPEIWMLLVAHGFKVGEEVEDFIFLEGIEEAGRHERYFGQFAGFDT